MMAAQHAAPIDLIAHLAGTPLQDDCVRGTQPHRTELAQAGIDRHGLRLLPPGLLPTIRRLLPQNGDVRQQAKLRHSALKGLPGYSRSGLDPFVRRESRATWRSLGARLGGMGEGARAWPCAAKFENELAAVAVRQSP
jgi:hypothetical protein